jgi:hypothetical protein
LVGKEDLQQQRQHPKTNRIPSAVPVQHHRRGVAHGVQVRTEVDHVSGEQEQHQRGHQPARAEARKSQHQVLARHAPDACARKLNAHHQRVGEEQRAADAVA